MNKILMTFSGILLAVNLAHADPVQTSLTVNFQKTTNFNQVQFDKLMQAKALIENVINSQEFKTAVLNFTYNGKKAFVQNNGLSNQQVYDNLMTGAEMYPKATPADHLMDYDIALYTSSYADRGILGYTNEDTTTIHVNTRFYNDAYVNEVAMNMVHEWTHKMGYDHDYERTARRPYSVPYGIGYLIRDLGAKKSLTRITQP